MRLWHIKFMLAFCPLSLFVNSTAQTGPVHPAATQLPAPASPAIAPGGQPPPASCGLLCQPSATLSLTLPVSTGQLGGLLQGRSTSIGFTVTSKALFSLQGMVTISVEGQSYSSSFFTLASKQSYSGTVQITNLPGGQLGINASFGQCKYETVDGPRVPIFVPCLPGDQIYATTSATLYIPPDQDYDGLSDDIEKKLIATYTPLMLFSKDNGQQEQYAPIDVFDYIQASTMSSSETGIASIPNSALQKTPTAILGSDPSTSLNAINSAQTAADLPRKLYISPSSSAEHGTAWSTVNSKKNVGLYGHVVLLNVAQIPDPTLSADLANRFCSSGPSFCTKYIFKVEYWQFFGYSHDFQEPSWVPFVLPFVGFDWSNYWPIGGLLGDIIDHPGDWCTVQLYIDPDQSAPDQAILAIYHYAHALQFRFEIQPATTRGPIPGSQYQIEQLQGPNAGRAVSFPDKGGAATAAFNAAQDNLVQIARVSATAPYTHPVVYVEWGGHEFWPTAAWSLTGAGNHNGQGYSYFAATPPNVGEVGAPMPGIAQAGVVTAFAGFWGNVDSVSHNGPPQGPALHAQWFWSTSTPANLLNVRPSKMSF
jgi:hypothetical protein